MYESIAVVGAPPPWEPSFSSCSSRESSFSGRSSFWLPSVPRAIRLRSSDTIILSKNCGPKPSTACSWRLPARRTTWHGTSFHRRCPRLRGDRRKRLLADGSQGAAGDSGGQSPRGEAAREVGFGHGGKSGRERRRRWTEVRGQQRRTGRPGDGPLRGKERDTVVRKKQITVTQQPVGLRPPGCYSNGWRHLGGLARSSALNQENGFLTHEVRCKSSEGHFSPAPARFSGPGNVRTAGLRRGREVFEGEESPPGNQAALTPVRQAPRQARGLELACGVADPEPVERELVEPVETAASAALGNIRTSRRR